MISVKMKERVIRDSKFRIKYFRIEPGLRDTYNVRRVSETEQIKLVKFREKTAGIKEDYF